MRIVLAGFNGTWRKETGEILSKRLGRKLFDIERIIEEKEKDRIAHISQVKGTDYLRSVESGIINEISTFENCIISIGPDVFSSKKNLTGLKSDSIVIWFTAEPSIILVRLYPGKESKRLLKKKEILAYIRQMIKDHDFSHFADRIIDTSELTPEETADRVQQILTSF